ADVEQNALGRIDGDERRVALAAVGYGIEQAGVGRPGPRHGLWRWVHGAGPRPREARRAARPPPPGGHRRQGDRVAPPAGGREGEKVPHATAVRCGRSKADPATGSECVASSKRCSTLFHSTIHAPRWPRRLRTRRAARHGGPTPGRLSSPSPEWEEGGAPGVPRGPAAGGPAPRAGAPVRA